jgi:hypothetical protein
MIEVTRKSKIISNKLKEDTQLLTDVDKISWDSLDYIYWKRQLYIWGGGGTTLQSGL